MNKKSENSAGHPHYVDGSEIRRGFMSQLSLLFDEIGLVTSLYEYFDGESRFQAYERSML